MKNNLPLGMQLNHIYMGRTGSYLLLFLIGLGLLIKPSFSYATNVDPVTIKTAAPLKQDTSQIKLLYQSASELIKQQPVTKQQLNGAAKLLKKAWMISEATGALTWKYKIQLLYGHLYGQSKLRAPQSSAYENAIAIAKKLGNESLEANAWYQYYQNVPDTVADYRNKTFYLRAEMAYRLYKKSAKTFGAHYREAELLREMADFHLEEENFDLAISELFQVIELAKKYKLPRLPMAYDLLSAVYNRKGEMSKALESALQSIKVAEANHEEVYVTYLNRVAAAYEAINKPQESIKWYTRSYHQLAADDPYIFIPAYMIATQLIKLNQAEKALSLLKNTWQGVKNKADDQANFMYLGFAESYTALGRYSQADYYFKRLLSPSMSLSNPFRTSVFFSASEFYFSQKKYSLALENAKKASLNQITMTLPRQIRLNEILYKIDLALNRPGQAIVHLQDFHRLKDSMLNQNNLEAIQRLQIEFQASQKENENELLRKKSQLQSQQLNRVQWIRNATITGLAFVSIVLVLLYGRFSLKKKLHNTLVRQKAEIDLAYAELERNVEQKNKLIEEKECLIREVHHRVKNNLQLTMSLLNSQSHYLEDKAAIEAIKESQHRLKSIALIHQKLYQTQNVSTIQIQPYIFELVEYLKESVSSDKKIKFNQHIIDLELDVSKAIPLGLIINEAITNIFKYAFQNRAGGKIDISLSACGQDEYLLLIKDNGMGLPPGFDYKRSNTLGLTLMKGLSGQIDANFSMMSENGVTVSLRFSSKEAAEPFND